MREILYIEKDDFNDGYYLYSSNRKEYISFSHRKEITNIMFLTGMQLKDCRMVKLDNDVYNLMKKYFTMDNLPF
jgi:hypothetical protein